MESLLTLSFLKRPAEALAAWLHAVDRLVQAVRQVFLGPLHRIGGTVQQDAGGAHALRRTVQRRRLRTVGQAHDGLVQHAARHDDGAIRGQQPFGLVVLDGSHAFLQRRILHGEAEHAAVRALLLLRHAIDQIVVVLVGKRTESDGIAGRVNAPARVQVRALLPGQRLARVEIDAPGPATVVVDGHPDMAAQRVFAEWRDQREPREQPLGDAPVIRIRFAVAAAVQRQAERVLLDVEHDVAVGLDVVVGLGALTQRIDIDLVAVHVRHVAGVDAAFHGLQVIGFLQPPGHVDMAFRQAAPLHLGQAGLGLGRPHVGPDDGTALDARIGLDAHAAAALRRRRHIHAFAQAVELQAVIGAADAVLFVAAEVQRHAAVRTELVDQPHLPAAVAECQQLLAHDLDPHRRTVGFGDLARFQDGDPVAPQQIAHGRARARAHQDFRGFLVHDSTASCMVCPFYDN